MDGKLQVVVDLKINNVIYECAICKKLKNNNKDRCQVCTQIKDINMTPAGPQVMVGTFLVCPDCFKVSDLQLEDPSKIIRPGFVPPKDLQIKPN